MQPAESPIDIAIRRRAALLRQPGEPWAAEVGLRLIIEGRVAELKAAGQPLARLLAEVSVYTPD